MKPPTVRNIALCVATLGAGPALAACGSSRSSSSTGSSSGPANAGSSELKGQTLTMAAYGGRVRMRSRLPMRLPSSSRPARQWFRIRRSTTQSSRHGQSGKCLLGCGRSRPICDKCLLRTVFDEVNVNLSGINPDYVDKSDKCGVPADVDSIVLMYNTKDFGKNSQRPGPTSSTPRSSQASAGCSTMWSAARWKQPHFEWYDSQHPLSDESEQRDCQTNSIKPTSTSTTTRVVAGAAPGGYRLDVNDVEYPAYAANDAGAPTPPPGIRTSRGGTAGRSPRDRSTWQPLRV